MLAYEATETEEADVEQLLAAGMGNGEVVAILFTKFAANAVNGTGMQEDDKRKLLDLLQEVQLRLCGRVFRRVHLEGKP